MIHWVAQIFYRDFFELFEGLVGIMGIRFEKNTSCYIILITYNKILIYLKNYMKIVWKLYEKTMKNI